MKKDLLTLYDLEPASFEIFFRRAEKMKKYLEKGVTYRPLEGKMLGLIFDKSSTRTRLSFEAAMFQMGGMATFLSRKDIQLGRGETIADTARVMSRYLDGVVIRTFGQDLVEEFAREASIPVINGLTDLLHPCQILGDLLTIEEKTGTYKGLRICYVGDGNNVANSWINAAARLPFHLSLACPEGYDPDSRILDRGRKAAPEGIALFRDPAEAARGADVVYTDVWASMGQEEEAESRKTVFRPYQVNNALLENAKKDVLVMHCLPAHRGEEITDAVMDGPRSIVYDQAENRLHIQKAVLETLLGGRPHE
ncbi:MAG TPA: ornithine carbamoyltransferase [Syntrophales bacterium]|nr:ornithine carbamoyltransferase [Syntrophales bacterium]